MNAARQRGMTLAPQAPRFAAIVSFNILGGEGLRSTRLSR